MGKSTDDPAMYLVGKRYVVRSRVAGKVHVFSRHTSQANATRQVKALTTIRVYRPVSFK